MTFISSTPRLLLLVLGATVIGAVVWWAVARERAATGGSTPSEWSLEQVAAFPDYPVFYLGENFNGLPLVTVIRELVDERPESPVPTERDGFTFTYGRCTIEPGVDACAVPLSVDVSPRCYYPREIFAPTLPRGPITTGAGGSEVQMIGGNTYIWTGSIVVRIAGGGASHEEAAKALTIANAKAIPAEEAELERPVSGECSEIQGRPRDEVLDLLAGKPPGRSSGASSGVEVPLLFIDANGSANGSCNEHDVLPTVPASATSHTVHVCLAENTGPNVDGIDLRLEYEDSLLAGLPEIDCPAAGGGMNCVDDNPGLNDGAGGVGTGWSCTAVGTSQPKADAAAGPPGQAVMQCHAALSSPSATLQNGLLATITLDPITPGLATLNPSLSTLSFVGQPPVACGPALFCAGAWITVE